MTFDELDQLESGGGTTIDAVESRAAELGITFPEDYAQFLVKYDEINFGVPSRHMAPNVPSALDEIIDCTGIEAYCLEDAEDGRYCYAFKNCVISTGNGEEILLITEPGKHFGHVLFWDRDVGGLLEDPDEVMDELDEVESADEQLAFLFEREVLSVVARSFTAFLRGIHSESS